MEDYYAAVKGAKLGTIDDLIKSYKKVGINCTVEKYEDEWQVTVGTQEDLLRITVTDGKIVFVTWQLGGGDEMVLEQTPEILMEYGLSNDPDADY